MSCARPVILGVDGQARAILEEARAGLAIEPENSEALVNAFVIWPRIGNWLASLEQNGREHIVRKFSRHQTAEKYIYMLERLLKLPERTQQERRGVSHSSATSRSMGSDDCQPSCRALQPR